jgi:hypothetical protein
MRVLTTLSRLLDQCDRDTLPASQLYAAGMAHGLRIAVGEVRGLLPPRKRPRQTRLPD